MHACDSCLKQVTLWGVQHDLAIRAVAVNSGDSAKIKIHPSKVYIHVHAYMYMHVAKLCTYNITTLVPTMLSIGQWHKK